MNIEYLLNEVNSIAAPAYLVGGSVRDILLGKEPNDYDFATPMSPDNVEAMIKASGRRAYQIGNSKRHGTMACKIDGQEVQITTFRTESYRFGSRQPNVEFVEDLEADLARRDFTMNAIAMDVNGDLHDPFNGSIDILHGYINAVGNARDRFNEDPLRMLRAFRFQAQLGFEVCAGIKAALRETAPSILTISKERWVQELDKLLMAPNAEAGISGLAEFNLLPLMIPELRRLFFFDFNEPWFLPDDSLNHRWSRVFERIEHRYTLKPPHDYLQNRDAIMKIAGHLKFSKERTQYLLQHC